MSSPSTISGQIAAAVASAPSATGAVQPHCTHNARPEDLPGSVVALIGYHRPPLPTACRPDEP
ncbi:hypothetical protein G3I59_20215 [Amycolatopsis rubida]|uniref:Uncharacterized protein n=1 Tax=Amycolatopsis rubida TaxID=112413 RepID=A0ABX0BX28_9PSEU|nr:hypothetical protein [Amycolatopsis sp. M39]NEC57857.1 hypothetical protein [Amycolatopsis rubida]